MGWLDETPRRRDAKKRYCRICDSRQDFVFDHGEGMYICTGHEL